MHKLIYISFLLLSVLSSAQAQEKKYVYRDSSLIQTEESTDSTIIQQEVEVVPAEQPAADVSSPDEFIDTSLYANSLGIPADSIREWRELKPFEYSKYLDSLLKERQAAEKKKTRGGTRFKLARGLLIIFLL